jgi:heme-degrading monooxygenase HmoA
MIARVWRARASVQLAHQYTKHFNEAVLPRLRALPGFRGAYLLQRADAAGVELVVQTLWDSMDAVKRFAGPEPDVAVVDEEARAVLISFDAFVHHYDVVVNP